MRNIRANLTMLCGDITAIDEHLSKMKKKDAKYIVISRERIVGEIGEREISPEQNYEECMRRMKEGIKEEKNIYFYHADSSSRKRMEMIKEIRCFCQKYGIKIWLSIMYFPTVLNNEIEKFTNEGWNEILIIGAANELQQITLKDIR